MMEMFDCMMYTVPNRGRAFCDGLDKLYCKIDEKPCPFYKPREVEKDKKEVKK